MTEEEKQRVIGYTVRRNGREQPKVHLDVELLAAQRRIDELQRERDTLQRELDHLRRALL